LTLLVGVLCKDGVVIAADRQATHGTLGQRTVGQAVTKIRTIGGTGLFASSGHLGLGQQLASIVEQKQPEFMNQPYDRFIAKLQAALRTVVDPALNTARIAATGVYGASVAAGDAICGSLLAAPFKDRLHLVEITPQVAVESMSTSLPFICLGSGKGSADPFLGFLKSVFWPDLLPSVSEGALAAFWTVQHAIDMKVDGVGFDVDVFVVAKAGNSYASRQLNTAELAEHTDFINASVLSLRGLRDGLGGSSGAGEVSCAPRPDFGLRLPKHFIFVFHLGAL
jgi:hypothetical protein